MCVSSDRGTVACFTVTFCVVLGIILTVWCGTDGFGIGAKVKGGASIRQESNKK